MTDSGPEVTTERCWLVINRWSLFNVCSSCSIFILIAYGLMSSEHIQTSTVTKCSQNTLNNSLFSFHKLCKFLTFVNCQEWVSCVFTVKTVPIFFVSDCRTYGDFPCFWPDFLCFWLWHVYQAPVFLTVTTVPILCASGCDICTNLVYFWLRHNYVEEL